VRIKRKVGEKARKQGGGPDFLEISNGRKTYLGNEVNLLEQLGRKG